jgi:hypothetical protein
MSRHHLATHTMSPEFDVCLPVTTPELRRIRPQQQPGQPHHPAIRQPAHAAPVTFFRLAISTSAFIRSASSPSSRAHFAVIR